MTRLAAGAALAGAALAAAGCPGNNNNTCSGAGCPDAKLCSLGDPTRPLQAAIVVPSNGAVMDISPGATVALVRPPQFGRILLIGVRVTNTDTCGVTINAALRDPCGGRIIGLEERPIALVPRGDGWGVPDQPTELSNFANVSVCPSAAAGSILDTHETLEVRVTDAHGRSVTLSADVVPSCAGDADCTATCAAAIDAGVGPDASCAPAPDAGP